MKPGIRSLSAEEHKILGNKLQSTLGEFTSLMCALPKQCRLTKQIQSLIRNIDNIRCHLEDIMFRDCPGTSTDVYYGNRPQPNIKVNERLKNPDVKYILTEKKK